MVKSSPIRFVISFCVIFCLLLNFHLPVFAQSPLPGDGNGDGRVDGLDYVRWLNNFNRNTSAGPTEGDYNNSGKVDGLDYIVWLNNFGRTQTTPTSTPPP